jgi:hypothetical protein
MGPVWVRSVGASAAEKISGIAMTSDNDTSPRLVLLPVWNLP